MTTRIEAVEHEIRRLITYAGTRDPSREAKAQKLRERLKELKSERR